MDKNGICRVPRCPNTNLQARGLCGKHYYRLKGNDPAARAEAEKYALPLRRRSGRSVGQFKRRVKASRARTGPKPPRRGVTLPTAELKRAVREEKLTKAAQMDQRIADERIAAVTEFATWMGFERLSVPQGFLYMDGTASNSVLLTKDGDLRAASLTIGDKIPAAQTDTDEG